MKKINKFLLIGAIAFSSCTKGVLDKAPLDIVSDAVLWNDPTLADAFLTQIYAEMTIWDLEFNPLSADDYKSGFFDITTVTDECKDGGWWWGSRAFRKYGNLKIDGGLLDYWGYNTIRKANEFIERIPSTTLSDDLKKKRIAEARYLRAFSYFSMVKRYGGIPLITKAQSITDPPETLTPARDKEQTIYDFVISEMNAIAGDLPEMSSGSDRGRASKYAAIALKCRAALYAGSISQFGTVQMDGVLGIDPTKKEQYYTEAYNAAKEIIDSKKFSLYNKLPNDKINNYRNLFTDKWNEEVILARDHNNVPMENGGTGIAYDFLGTPKPNGWGAGQILVPYLEMIEEYEHIDGSSGKLDDATISNRLWTTEELWANKDPRFFATIATENTQWRGRTLTFYNGIIKPNGDVELSNSFNGILPQGNQFQNNCGFSVLKYLDPNNDISTYSNSTTSIQVFRLGEILLNYAEAAFETGKTAEALEAVNAIRERAGIVKLTSIDRNKIRHERKVELAYEGHRYWDARRWRIAETAFSGSMRGLRYVLDYNTRKYILLIENNIDGIPLAFYPRNYYLPLTIPRTASNPNLKENPGYN
ncbi:MAG: RagB/SusD family nutrient uptake outer membrane protein [Citrobacter freundii]|nr:MAG: RagB/SusD family nutrient uptake outer membrane protein [Citrobacter freundii]